MLNVFAKSPTTGRFVQVNAATQAGRAAISQATEVEIVTAICGKDVLMDHATKVNHFAPWTGVQAAIREGSEGEMVVNLTGLVPATAEAWTWIAIRLAGRQEAIVEALTVEHQPSKVRQQFVTQFLPSMTAGGSRLANQNRQDALLANADYVRFFLPIFVEAKMIKA